MKTSNSIVTSLVVLLVILCVINTSMSFKFYKILQDERMKISILENQINDTIEQIQDISESIEPIKKSFNYLRTKVENTIIQSIQRFDDTLREIEGTPVAIPLKINEIDKKIQVIINELDNLNKKLNSNLKNDNN